ncbi:hypothetical protein D3C71_2083800 [compost metagenome]
MHLGETDIDPVKVGEQVADQQQRRQSPGDEAVSTVACNRLENLGSIGYAHGLILFVCEADGTNGQAALTGLSL